MAVDFAADPLAELTHYRDLGVDGVFVDCPSTAREWKLATGQLTAQPESWLATVAGGPGEISGDALSGQSLVLGCTLMGAAISSWPSTLSRHCGGMIRRASKLRCTP